MSDHTKYMNLLNMPHTNQSTNHDSASAILLKLPHIAAWQIARTPAKSGPESAPITAALPAMQRGAVWKPRQVEMLWDSIVRGFPIGAFLLSPFDEARGVQSAKHEQVGVGDPTHHLLDGQQRSTAIALGFLNPWRTMDHTTVDAKKWTALLWVDLAAPDEDSDTEFVFRVVTRSHPWGYKRNKPEETLTFKTIRESLEAFRDATPDIYDVPPHQIPLTHVWPADALAPVPLVFLIEELAEGGSNEMVTARLQTRLQTLPFWDSENGHWQEVKKRLDQAFSGENVGLHQRWIALIQRLRNTVSLTANYGVPGLILPQTARPETDSTADPLETLFIRVNRAGTPLEGEELMYSILKSSWVDAPQFVETLAAKLAHPPRLVVLATRLVMAQEQEAEASRPPASPSVAQFRKLVHDQESRKRLTTFVEGHATQVFDDARTILTDTQLAGGDYALPPVLAFELAHKTPDVLFLLLYWILRMQEAGKAPTQIKAEQRRRLLGFLTALSWFAPDPTAAVAAVWSDLKTAKPNALPNFFSKPAFEKTLRLGKYDKLIACPLPTPGVLEQVIRNRVTGATGNYGGFNQADHDFWRKWNWYEWLYQTHPAVLTHWFNDVTDAIWNNRMDDEDTPPLDWTAKRSEAWKHFLDQLWDKKSLLLFVQRQWLNRWFPEYDPTVPDQTEDKNRPWDWDHIHPQRYLVNESGNKVRRIPEIIREWHGSIGNLRAWPLELNRADGDISPRQKFSDYADRDQKSRYHMTNIKDDCDASFVGYQVDDWDDWCASVPKAVENGEQSKRYLALGEDGGTARQALVRAITQRFIKLYRHWYEGLLIADLMP